MHRKYVAHMKRNVGGPCPLCTDDSIRDFTHWRILLNDFPYDVIAKTHHMIVPKRHVTEHEITQEEWQEYQEIKKDYLQLYDVLLESTSRMKSIPEHFHIHLIIERGA